MTFKVPKKVKVGQLTCPISKKKFDASIYARFDRVTQDIKYSHEMIDNDILRIALLHEIVHAMETNNTCIDYLSEDQVDNIASGMYSLIRDNKKFIEWIQNVQM